jgi:hypothetical protein
MAAKQDNRYRSTFLDKGLLYLFSYNVEAAMDAENIGVSSDGLRLNVRCIPNSGRVYHVLGERVVGGLGFPAITGRIVDGEDRALIRPDDVTISDVRATIETDDGFLIDSRYRGVTPLGQGGYRAFASGTDKLGTVEQPFVIPVVVTPRYETEAEKYRWLTNLQCVGFGRLLIIKNVLRRITYDIYSMT